MAEKQVRAYWANIPAPVLYDDALSANAKLLYGEITTLMHFVGKEGYCDASNQELAEGHKWNAKSVSRLVAALADARIHRDPAVERPQNGGHDAADLSDFAATPLRRIAETPLHRKVHPPSAKKWRYI